MQGGDASGGSGLPGTPNTQPPRSVGEANAPSFTSPDWRGLGSQGPAGTPPQPQLRANQTGGPPHGGSSVPAEATAHHSQVAQTYMAPLSPGKTSVWKSLRQDSGQFCPLQGLPAAATALSFTLLIRSKTRAVLGAPAPMSNPSSSPHKCEAPSKSRRTTSLT